MLDLIMVLVGVGLLAGGAELLIRGAMNISRLLAVPPLVSGLVVVGFGTSMPELVVSVNAARSGSADIAVGNVLGSNIANVLLIIGVCALIAPLKVKFSSVRRDAGFMVASAVLLILLLQEALLSQAGAALLLITLLGYLLWTFRMEIGQRTPAARMHQAEAGEISRRPLSPKTGLFESLAGIALLAGGSKVLLHGVVSLAQAMTLPESLIGLTLVAVGTSLPELMISVVAMRRGHSDVAVGNVLGSNIFNVLGILGLAALFTPLRLSEQLVIFDQWVLLGVSLLFWLLLFIARPLGQRTGVTLLLLYAVFLVAGYGMV